MNLYILLCPADWCKSGYIACSGEAMDILLDSSMGYLGSWCSIVMYWFRTIPACAGSYTYIHMM